MCGGLPHSYSDMRNLIDIGHENVAYTCASQVTDSHALDVVLNSTSVNVGAWRIFFIKTKLGCLKLG